MTAESRGGQPTVRYQPRDRHDIITLQMPGPRQHDGVTIQNGSVQQFNTGVALRSATDSRVTGLRTGDVFSAVLLKYASRNEITRSSLSSHAHGIELADGGPSRGGRTE